MGTYFKSWRRKFGVVTLVIACTFAAGWVRSNFVGDLVTFEVFGSPQSMISIDDQILWWIFEGRRPGRWTALTTGLNFVETLEWIEEARNLSREIRAATKKSPMHGQQHLVFTEWRIPYWLIATPLALISVWLLLSKPRDRESKPATES